MAFVDIDGIRTHYQIEGNGPALLMFAPGGFDATMDKWRHFGVYQRINLLGHLPDHFQCILFDRRENGESGGRVEAIGWSDFVGQAVGLLDHLGVEAAHLMGGCIGCSPVLAMAAHYPERVRSMVHYWPVGGARYRINAHQRFAAHADYVTANGLGGVVSLVQSHDKNFSQDPAGGPWNNVIRKDKDFAAHYAAMDQTQYLEILRQMVGGLFDRDTAPGATAEDLLSLHIPSLIVPGKDAAHATSAARYLEEVLEGSDYWDLPPDAQTEQNVPERVLAFLRSV